MPQPVLLITGTSSGIGLSTSVVAARHGYRVVATMRNLDGAGPLRAAAEEAGGTEVGPAGTVQVGKPAPPHRACQGRGSVPRLTTGPWFGQSPQALYRWRNNRPGWAERLSPYREHRPTTSDLPAEDADIASVLKADQSVLTGCGARQKSCQGPIGPG